MAFTSGDLLNEFQSNVSDMNQRDNSKIINTLSINPVTNTLFSGYDDGRLEFYDYINGSLQQSGYSPSLSGSENEAAIYASTFDMSGLRLLTCHGDKSIRIWGSTLLLSILIESMYNILFRVVLPSKT